MRQVGNVYKISFGKSEGKKLLWIYKHRMEDNIKIDLKRVRYEDVETGFTWFKIGINGGFLCTR
jgi:hypothetical protein